MVKANRQRQTFHQPDSPEAMHSGPLRAKSINSQAHYKLVNKWQASNNAIFKILWETLAPLEGQTATLPIHRKKIVTVTHKDA